MRGTNIQEKLEERGNPQIHERPTGVGGMRGKGELDELDELEELDEPDELDELDELDEEPRVDLGPLQLDWWFGREDVTK